MSGRTKKHVRHFLQELRPEAQQKILQVASLDRELPVKAIEKIISFDSQTTQFVFQKLEEFNLVRRYEPVDGFVKAELATSLRVAAEEKLNVIQLNEVQQLYRSYYYQLARILYLHRDEVYMKNIATVELPNLEYSLRQMLSVGSILAAHSFANYLEHLQQQSPSLVELIKDVRSNVQVIEKAEKQHRSVTFTPYSDKIENLRYKLTTPVVRVPWRMLAASSNLFSDVIAYYTQLQSKTKELKYDIDRLHKIYSLNPDVIYIGLDEFEGYVVFYFSKPRSAVLDSPEIGNAIYIINGEWMSLARLSKRDLLAVHPNRTRRIVHSGQWFERLQEYLYWL